MLAMAGPSYPKKISVKRNTYKGDRETIIISIDVGTTYSGVSFARLFPGEVPKIEGVTRCVSLYVTDERPDEL